MILAALGLGSLYMMHLLAQDYNKIRKPAMTLARFLLMKRDLNAVLHTTPEQEVITSTWIVVLREILLIYFNRNYTYSRIKKKLLQFV